MFFKSKKISVFAPCRGTVLPLERVPDEVFSGKILGEGCAVDSRDDVVCAPISGEITMVSDTRHAYAIRSAEGFEVLVHIGIDTVKLKGEGFTLLVGQNQRIKAGEPLVSVDFKKIADRGYCTLTVVVVSPHSDIKKVEITNEVAEKLDDEIFAIYRK